MKKEKMRKGFTLLELIVVMAVMSILLVISLTSLYSLNTSQAFKQDVIAVVSALRQARALTIASYDNSQYGVHVETSRAVLFKGNSYSVSDPENVTYPLHQFVQVNVVLTGGENDVIFQRLSGNTTQSGTITMFPEDNSASSVINIFSTGIIEKQ